jgi:UDP-glucose 4-epimerase
MKDLKGRVLVTGGAGFIGSHVAGELKAAGYEVVILDDLSGGFKENIPSGVEFVEGSITDHDLVSRLFDQYEFDYVFHLAAYAAEGLSHFIRRFNYMNNIIGSANLINEAIKHEVRCFVFTSSIAVYGENQVPLKEELTPMPEDPYGIAKYAVEMDLKNAHDMFGLNYIIFRPHNVYGENQNLADKYRNVIGIFMNSVMEGKPLTIFGDGEQTRAFSYITDVAPLIARSIEMPKCYGETFNVGADKPYTVNHLAETVINAMDKKAEVLHVEARNEVKHAYSDHTKVRQFFGEQNYTDLEEGIRRMAAWALKTGIRRAKEFDAIEIRKKLPPIWASSQDQMAL